MEAPRSGHVAALDGIRGIAVALVVGVHAYGSPSGGFLGVDVFFVLSGFLITTLLLREHARRGAISLPRFYARRALRLLPALVVVLGAYAAVALFVVHPVLRATSLHDLVGTPLAVSTLYVSNVYQAWNGLLPAGIRHLWSLATEEQFYLVWPLLLVVLMRFVRDLRILARILVGAIAVIAAYRAGLALSSAAPLRIYFAPDTTFDQLLVGCLFAVWLVDGRAPELLLRTGARRIAWPLALAFVAACVWLVPGWTSRTATAIVLLPFALACGLLVYLAATDTRSLLARTLALEPLRFLGRISYGLYLWHPLVLWFAVFAPIRWSRLQVTPTEAVLVAVLLSLCSYALVERPFLRRKERFAAATLVMASDRELSVSGPLPATTP